MKRVLFILIILSIFLVGCGFGGGDITTTEPIVIDTENFIEITSVDELMGMEMNKSYILMNDLDLQGQEWMPLGTNNSPFLGIFDGNNKTISNLSISKDNSYNGLFGKVEGKIFDLSLLDFVIDYTTDRITFAGGLAGLTSGDVENVSVSGNINIINAKSNTYAGLLLGTSQKVLDAPYDLTSFKANLVRDNQASGDIDVVSERIAFIGGLIGKNFNSIISENYVDVDMTVITNLSHAYAGGLIGHNFGGIVSGYEVERISKNIAITNNIAISDLNIEAKEANAYVGGLIGYNFYGDSSNNYSKTSIVSKGTLNVMSLLVGEDWNSDIESNFAKGDLSYSVSEIEENYEGAFVGRSFGNTEITSNYYNSVNDLSYSEYQINDADAIDSQWYIDNLNWEVSFINKFLD